MLHFTHTAHPNCPVRPKLSGVCYLLVRCYFHIPNGQQVIRDVEGIEVSDIEAMEAAALAAIKEVQREDAYTADEWRGCWVEAVAASGQPLKRIPLDLSFKQ